LHTIILTANDFRLLLWAPKVKIGKFSCCNQYLFVVLIAVSFCCYSDSVKCKVKAAY